MKQWSFDVKQKTVSQKEWQHNKDPLLLQGLLSQKEWQHNKDPLLLQGLIASHKRSGNTTKIPCCSKALLSQKEWQHNKDPLLLQSLIVTKGVATQQRSLVAPRPYCHKRSGNTTKIPCCSKALLAEVTGILA